MRGSTTRVAWLVVAIGLIPGVIQSQPTLGAADQRVDDLAVFVALLNHPSLAGASDKRSVVVTKELVSPPLWSDEYLREENLRRFLKKPAPSTIDAFLKAVQREGEVPVSLGRRPDITVVPGAELARELEAPGPDSWRTFARRYPQARGIVSLSAIAYGESGDEAMAYLGFSCGLVCGHGLAVVLQRNGSQWVAVEHMYLWES
jgi:hypothetical protein